MSRCEKLKMKPDPVFHPSVLTRGRQRKSVRLKGHDYSQAGGYYVTLVTQLRESFFGNIAGGEMIFNGAGRMVEAEWKALEVRFPGIETDVFQVMPNHFHGIIFIDQPGLVGAGLSTPKGHVPAGDENIVPVLETKATTRVAPTLGRIIGAFKSITTHKYIQGVEEFKWPVFPKRLWQRNYVSRVFSGL